MTFLKLGKAEILLVGIILVHIVIGIVLYFSDLELFISYVKEDRYIENLTALVLFAASFHFLWKAIKAKNKLLKISCVLLFLLFLFGGGEEISYGQRIFGFDTPSDYAEINGQGEVTVHNLNINGVDINRLVFSTILYVSAFIYFIGFPLLYRKSKWIRSWKYFLVPVPKLMHGILFTLFFLLILVTQSDIKGCWEIEEFNLVSFLYLTFLFQQNKTFMANPGENDQSAVSAESSDSSDTSNKKSRYIEA
ncbi:hypothetical protein QQ020_32105 [Fulvivirgaceae bacterium BMA12]|uniref:Uncharacterized protein n=1 Tax=Agaribacillus aureus TaxID=3051825 RepID=A0ABT8LGS7_9BACT|nr:hypothetical protein [Fulvivirgaceae bacterium BMA12]